MGLSPRGDPRRASRRLPEPPSSSSDDLSRVPRKGIGQPIHVEDAVEVVVLVLEDARQPAARLHVEGPAVEIRGSQERAFGSAKRRTARPGPRGSPRIPRRHPVRPPGVGLIQSSGSIAVPRCSAPSSSRQFQMKSRSGTPTCGAARPTPGAAAMVSSMSRTSSRSSSSMSPTGAARRVEDGLARDADRTNGHSARITVGLQVDSIGCLSTSPALDSVIGGMAPVGIIIALVGGVFLALGAQFQHRGVEIVEARTARATRRV